MEIPIHQIIHDRLVNDIWIFLTNNTPNDTATIGKEAFFHEVTAMLNAVYYFNSIKQDFSTSSPEEKQLLITKKIKAKLQDCKLNNVQFAKLVGVQRPLVTKWLGGNHNFTISTIVNIENALGIELLNVN